MKKLIILSLGAVLAVALVGFVFFKVLRPATPAEEPAAETVKVEQDSTGWFRRCADEIAGTDCAVVRKLTDGTSGERVAEFSVALPSADEVTRGTVVMPLGVLLPPGGALRIDGGTFYRFSFHSCTAEGCRAYIDLSDELLTQMGAGIEAAFYAKTATGDDMVVRMDLSGFAEALSGMISQNGMGSMPMATDTDDAAPEADAPSDEDNIGGQDAIEE